jgi:hypothetical protein
MKGSDTIIELGIAICLFTIVLAAISQVQYRRSGRHTMGWWDRLLGFVFVFGHVLVPTPGIAVMVYIVSSTAQLEPASALSILAIPMGFLTGISTFVIGVSLGNTIAERLGIGKAVQVTSSAS